MDSNRKIEAKFLYAARRKFPGLSPERAVEITEKVKKDNNGSLLGLKLKTFFGLVAKEIHDQYKIESQRRKEERDHRAITCDVCFHTFSDSSARNRHMEAKHGKEPARMDLSEFTKKCPKCKKCFKYEFSLTYHVDKFHKEKDASESNPDDDESSSIFECKTCGEVFKHQPSLKRHMKTHMESGNFDCEKCDATFTRKDNLMKHGKRVHGLVRVNVGLLRESNKNESICKVCGRNIGKNCDNLVTHLSQRVCQQSKHEEIIELDDDLKYPCSQCDKTYAEKDYLDRHVRWKHENPMVSFPCSKCKASFKLKSSLSRHMKKEHIETKASP